jgi:molecular chaperone DnaJ
MWIRESVGSSQADTTSAHKNEGFFKAAWHRLTHQHDNLVDDSKGEEKKEKPEADEPKKASGSG